MGSRPLVKPYGQGHGTRKWSRSEESKAQRVSKRTGESRDSRRRQSDPKGGEGKQGSRRDSWGARSKAAEVPTKHMAKAPSDNPESGTRLSKRGLRRERWSSGKRKGKRRKSYRRDFPYP